jgi:hypothetical protein
MLYSESISAKKTNYISDAGVQSLFFELANKDIEVGIGEFRVLSYDSMGFHIKSQSIPVES